MTIAYSIDAVSSIEPPSPDFCGVVAASGTIPFVSVTAAVARELRRHGYDPDDFMRMTWPSGASRYAEGRFLMTDARLTELLAAQDDLRDIAVRMGSASFSRMTLLRPAPMFNSEISGPVWDVRFVDERYHWQDVTFGAYRLNEDGSGSGDFPQGFNVTTLRKTSIWAATGDPSNPVPVGDGTRPGPWTIQGAVYRALDLADGDAWIKNEFAVEALDFGDIADPLLSDKWRDFNLSGMAAPEALDRLLAMAGRVLVACPDPGSYPQVTTQGSNPFVTYSGRPRYYALPIEIGDEIAAAFAETYGAEAMQGGFHTATDDWTPPASGGALQWQTPPAAIVPHAPASVDVLFPIWSNEATGWAYEDSLIVPPGGPPFDLGPFQIFKWQTYTTNNGRPAVGGSGSYTLHATLPCLLDRDTGEIDNESDMLEEAASLSRVYYARFRAGVPDLTIRGLRDAYQWPGAGQMVWQIRDGLPRTRLVGTVDDPLYGFDHRRPLSAQSIEAVGAVRAVQRPHGGVLIDAPIENRGRLWLGVITAVYPDGSGNNATYDAESVENPCEDGDTAGTTGLCVREGTPERFHPTTVDIVPAVVGTPCIIAEIDGQTASNRTFWVAETPRTVDCDDVQGAAEAQQAGPGLPRGSDPRIYQIHGL